MISSTLFANIPALENTRAYTLTHAQTAELARQAQAGDMAAAHRIVEGHLLLIPAAINKYFRAHLHADNTSLEPSDLFQEAVIGLQRAVRDYDPHVGRFSTYAFPWIRSYVGRAIQKKERAIGLPVHVQADCLHEARISGLDTKDVIFDRQLPVAENWLDHPMAGSSNKESEPLSELLPAIDEGIGDTMAVLLRDDLQRALARLTPRQATVLRRRFGLDGDEEHTLEQVAAQLQISVNRVSQVQRQALKRLREYMAGWECDR